MTSLGDFVVGAVRRPLAFVLGLAVPVLVTLSADSPTLAAQASSQLIEVFSRQSMAAFLPDALFGDMSWGEPTATNVRPSLAVNSAAGRIAPASVSSPAPAPRLVSANSFAGPLATMVPIPLEIENADRLERDTVVLVTNVPENAALSAGRPLGAGTWIVPAGSASELGIIAYAKPPARQRLLFDLVSPEGTLISSAQASLEIAQPERSRRAVSAGVASQGTIRSAAVDMDALRPTRRP